MVAAGILECCYVGNIVFRMILCSLWWASSASMRLKGANSSASAEAVPRDRLFAFLLGSDRSDDAPATPYSHPGRSTVQVDANAAQPMRF